MTGQHPAADDWSAGPPPPAAQAVAWAASAPVAAAAPLVEPLPAVAASRVILVAALAGITAQYLFVGQRLGLNFVLWVALVLGGTWLLRRQGVRIDRADAWLPVTALLFAAFVALRVDEALYAFDVPAAGALTLLSALAVSGVAVTRRGLTALAALAGNALTLFFTGATALRPGVRPLTPRLARDSTVLRILRGLLVALPLLIVFVALFAAADGVFSAHLRTAFRLDLGVDELLYRLLFVAAAAWLFAGTVVIPWASAERMSASAAAAEGRLADDWRPLGGLEGIVVLLTLDVLFALFVLIQAAYLFGGLDTLEVSGMTYAEYARRGFFELLAVGVLTGGLLLLLDRLIQARGWAYRATSVVLAALTAVVLLSAVVRLGLYQQAYGWTELRFFALAAICWLGLGIIVTAGGLLLDRAGVVPKLLLGLGLAVAVAVNLIGPQSFVAAQNLQRAVDQSLVPADGRSGVDFDYLNSLGYAAVPAVVAALPHLAGQNRQDAEDLLRRQAAALARQAQSLGWPSWNHARHNAIEALLASGFLVRPGG